MACDPKDIACISKSVAEAYPWPEAETNSKQSDPLDLDDYSILGKYISSEKINTVGPVSSGQHKINRQQHNST